MSSAILKSTKRKYDGLEIFYLGGRFFKTNGVQFEVTGSAITGDGIHDVVHTIKNVEKGTYAEITMDKLISILKQSE